MQMQLSSLSGCLHMFCIDCAVATAAYNAACPLCRIPYTTVFQAPDQQTHPETDPLTGPVTYHVASGTFHIPGLVPVNSFCMGLAKSLIIEDEDEERLVKMPEYLHHMLGCSPLYWMFESHGDENGEMGADDLNTQRFDEMETGLVAWRDHHEFYSRIVVAQHVQKMISENIFICLVMESDAESVAQRLEDHDPEFPSEIDGGHKILLCSLPLEDA